MLLATFFTLSTQPDRSQLDRLTMLAQSALAELQMLIEQMHPQEYHTEDLVHALRQHLAQPCPADGLTVTLEVEGDCLLSAAEEQWLFRIVHLSADV